MRMSDVRTVVIGLGNPLMCDDGVGLAALQRLGTDWEFSPPVELIDGGTWGLNLLPVIEFAEQIILIDAIDVGAQPGAPVTLLRDQLPRLLQVKVSPHQIAVAEVIALAQLRGTLPERVLAIGLQPARVELSAALSEECQGALGELLSLVLRQLEQWGHHAFPSTCPGASTLCALPSAGAPCTN
jgi:hydrogenase maturation protease